MDIRQCCEDYPCLAMLCPASQGTLGAVYTLFYSTVRAALSAVPLRNMRTKHASRNATCFIALCFILWLSIAAASPVAADLPEEVREEASNVHSESPFYTCRQSQDTFITPICSCDPSCNRYGVCCIDVAKDVPHVRYMCNPLPSGGRQFWVIVSCAERRIRQGMKERCQGQFRGDFPYGSFQYSIDIPSFHEPSRVLYRNRYCLDCNGGRRDEAYSWHSKLDWVGPSPGNMSADSQQQMMMYNAERNVYWMMHAGIMYNATVRSAAFEWKNFTKAFNTMECSPTVDECPKGSDPALARKCALYAAYYTPSGTKQVTYKNFHCALCNGVSRTTVEKDGERAKFIQSLISLQTIKPTSDDSLFELDPQTDHTKCGDGHIRLPGLNCCQAFGCRGGTEKGTNGCLHPNGTLSHTWLVFERDQVTILPNHTLYLNFNGKIVSSDDYEIDSWTGRILVRVQYKYIGAKFTSNALPTEPTQCSKTNDHPYTWMSYGANFVMLVVIILCAGFHVKRRCKPSQPLARDGAGTIQPPDGAKGAECRNQNGYSGARYTAGACSSNNTRGHVEFVSNDTHG
ncbi:uncharacterized protein LOC135392023 isoform X2 [Ornithodoros turicata]|uniref:uncharacterized protein LOC135392023 isoform X2 n=1 Tax=Ornithodoros turicata TaxID=34597 RepID=UPI00313927AD